MAHGVHRPTRSSKYFAVRTPKRDKNITRHNRAASFDYFDNRLMEAN